MIKKRIEELLRMYPEVKWDRYAVPVPLSLLRVMVFGWIDRPDGKFDFLVLVIDGGEIIQLSTSSARYSKEFCIRAFGEDSDHADCERVELNFDVPNCVRLNTTLPPFHGECLPDYLLRLERETQRLRDLHTGSRLMRAAITGLWMLPLVVLLGVFNVRKAKRIGQVAAQMVKGFAEL